MITQLKAYYIGMGGTLASIHYGRNSQSMLDKVIFDGFQAHLWLTLLSNIHLLSKFPLFMAAISEGADNDCGDDFDEEPKSSNSDEDCSDRSA